MFARLNALRRQLLVQAPAIALIVALGSVLIIIVMIYLGDPVGHRP